MEINENTKLCSFDIENIYTNISVTEVKNIIKEILNNDNHTPEKEKQELTTLLNTILEQNYLQFSDQFYKQNEGLGMGSPTSTILAETFIQCLEHTNIIKILNINQIIDYYRYVNYILIIYNTQTTNIENTLMQFTSVHPKIKLTMEKEVHSTLNYLDLTITNKHNQLTFGIY
jgi:hypothetical protein